MLRRGGCFRTAGGRCGNFEFLHGFRWFEFDEDFRWDIASATGPTNLTLSNEVQNTLLGYQVGSRANVCLTDRIAFNAGTRVGLFNNRARVRQGIIGDNGVYATVGQPGPDFDFVDAKNDVSFLGEFDLGVSRLMSRGSRLNIGYRAIGVSGLALAPDQFSNFAAEPAIRDVRTNGSLLLHGAYFGFEACR